jgi:HD-GYP domain-containing protein (c-di-GMP phosphodiesterase class II)
LVEILSGGEVYWNNDVQHDPRLAYPVLFEGMKSAAIAPLSYQGETLGLLGISHAGELSAQVVSLFTTIADIAATALHRSSLYEQARRDAEQMAAVEAIGRSLAATLDPPEIYARLAGAVQSLLPDIATIIVSCIDRERTWLQCVYAISYSLVLELSEFPSVRFEPSGRDPQSEAIRTRQPVVVNDLQARLSRRRKPSPSKTSIELPLPQSAIYMPLVSKGETLGVIQVQSYTLSRFGENDRRLLAYVANAAAISLENSRLFGELQDSHIQALLTLAEAMDAREISPADHSQRLADWAVEIALCMGCSESEVQEIRWAGMLHDIGKASVPEAILRKPGPLTAEEWEIVHRHPLAGEQILTSVRKLQGVVPLVGGHHERYDGRGYPRGLRGEDIPLGARILAVVDAYIAMTEERAFRKALSQSQVMTELRGGAGTQFDPYVVDMFLALSGQSELESSLLEQATV